jgi:FkbM family methyltransferase
MPQATLTSRVLVTASRPLVRLRAQQPPRSPRMASGESAMMRTLVAVNRSRVVQSAGVLRKPMNRLVWGVVEARLVRETVPYLLNTLRSARTPRRYHLKSNGSVFYLRHHTGDVAIFRKFTAYHYYDFPRAVDDRLRGASISVVDLGANIGLFGVHVRSNADVATMVSFEPDEANAAVVERVIAEYGGSWKLVKACASNRDAEARFAGGNANLSRIADEGGAVPVVDAIPYLVAADLVKVNIEGAEWDILADERFVAQSPPVLILEYHKIASPEPDIRSLVLRLLSAAGYSGHEMVNQSDENGLIWAWKDGSGEASASG